MQEKWFRICSSGPFGVLFEKSLWRRNNANTANQCNFATVEAGNCLGDIGKP